MFGMAALRQNRTLTSQILEVHQRLLTHASRVQLSWQMDLHLGIEVPGWPTKLTDIATNRYSPAGWRRGTGCRALAIKASADPTAMRVRIGHRRRRHTVLMRRTGRRPLERAQKKVKSLS